MINKLFRYQSYNCKKIERNFLKNKSIKFTKSKKKLFSWFLKIFINNQNCAKNVINQNCAKNVVNPNQDKVTKSNIKLYNNDKDHHQTLDRLYLNWVSLYLT